MPVLQFTTGPQAVGQLHDILACLVKFNEDISIEASSSELRISSLNISKTAYAAFTLSGNKFFDKYHFVADQSGTAVSNVWACKLQNRALASVFRRRLADNRDKDTALEYCEFELQASTDLPECRLIIRLYCRFGVVKTYRLTYETGEILHASFDKVGSANMWSVSSKTLRDVVEYFGPKTEQLDWYLQDGQVTFTSYTEKVQNGKEILKQPMHTSVAIKRRDFNECNIDENLHIGIIVKDFRAIVAHAETLSTLVTARYSRGNRPMQISYSVAGVVSEFTLMTRSVSSASTTNTTSTLVRDLSVRPVTEARQQGSRSETMAPPSATATSSRTQAGQETYSDNRPELQARTVPFRSAGAKLPQQRQSFPPSASINENSLFIPEQDDDNQWDPQTYGDDEPDFVTWDNDAVGGYGAHDGHQPATVSRSRLRDSDESGSFAFLDTDDGYGNRKRPRRQISEIPPTQRLSQVQGGLFD